MMVRFSRLIMIALLWSVPLGAMVLLLEMNWTNGQSPRITRRLRYPVIHQYAWRRLMAYAASEEANRAPHFRTPKPSGRALIL
jgi:hypothetical protein